MAICIVKRWEKSHGLPFCSWLKSSSLSGRRLEEVGERENGRARGRHARGESPSRVPVFSCAHYSQAPATQARNHHTQELSYMSIFFRFSSAIFASVAWSLFVEIQKFCHHNNETKPFDGSTRFVPYVPMRGCRAEWAWERIFEALKAPWEGQKKQPHATHVSFFGWPFPWLFFLFGDASVSN